MGDHRTDLVTQLGGGTQHEVSLVPGVEHFTAINPLNSEHMGDDLVPVNVIAGTRQPQHGDAGPIVTHVQHLAGGARGTRQLQANIEALSDPQIRHNLT